MRARLFLARLPEAAGKLLGGCKPVLSENLQSCTRQISTESLAPGSLRYTGSSDKTFSTLLSGATKQQLGHPGVSFAAQAARNRPQPRAATQLQQRFFARSPQQQQQAGALSQWQQQLQDAKRSGRRILAAPQRAVRSARNQIVRAGEGVYNVLPSQAKRFADSLAKPGSTQKVIKLHFEAFWNAHGRKVIAAFAFVAVYYIWRGMFGLTSMMFNLSETMAEFGFLALAAAMAAFGYLWLRRRWTINPDSVYRSALRRLNTDPGVLEVLGAPVAGSDVRASVTTGGGLRLRGLVPAIRPRRLQMIFPLSGADRRGLVSLEAKKRKGKYQFKLLAVDVPTATGTEQRLYLDGDARAYDRGGVIRELRDPFLHALAMRDAYEAEDDVDDAADEAEHAQHDREALAAAVRPLQGHQKPSIAQVPFRTTPEGQGEQYFTDRASFAIRSAAGRAWDYASKLVPSSSQPVSAESTQQAPLPAARSIDGAADAGQRGDDAEVRRTRELAAKGAAPLTPQPPLPASRD